MWDFLGETKLRATGNVDRDECGGAFTGAE